MSEHNPEQPFNQGQIPDNAPVIAMDIALGKKYDSIDVDYAALAEQAEKVGLSTKRLSGLTIDLRLSGLATVGEYKPKYRTIYVKSGPKSNQVLAHELQHAADDERGMPRSNLSYYTGAVALRTAPIVALSTLIPTYAGVNAGNKLAYMFALGPSQVIASLPLAIGMFYYFSKDEVRARKAERDSREVISYINR